MMAAHAKDCPLCGGAMRLTTRRTVDRVPGTNESKARETNEWVCPDCDYYEEAEEEDWR